MKNSNQRPVPLLQYQMWFSPVLSLFVVILNIIFTCLSNNVFIKVLSYAIRSYLTLRNQDPGWSHASEWFNTATFVCLSHARTWISNVICHGIFVVFHGLRWEEVVRFVDIGEIVDHYCLNFHFIIPFKMLL